MIKIEKGKEEFIDDIFGLALHECEEFHLPICPTKKLIEKYIKESNNHNVFARCLVIQEVVIGFIFCRHDENMPTALIEQLFIHKKFRGSFAFLRLLKQTVDWAKEKECQMILIGGMCKINKEHAAALGFIHEMPFYGKEL